MLTPVHHRKLEPVLPMGDEGDCLGHRHNKAPSSNRITDKEQPSWSPTSTINKLCAKDADALVIQGPNRPPQQLWWPVLLQHLPQNPSWLEAFSKSTKHIMFNYQQQLVVCYLYVNIMMSLDKAPHGL